METVPEAWIYLIGIIVPFVAGLLLKSGWPAEVKFVIVVIISGLFGAGSLWVQGSLVPAEWTPEGLVIITSQVFVASQVIWHGLIKRLPGVRAWLEQTLVS